jgi:hypothetical protein
MTRYASEYDIPGIPKFVKKTIIPLTYFVGKIWASISISKMLLNHKIDFDAPIRALMAWLQHH